MLFRLFKAETRRRNKFVFPLYYICRIVFCVSALTRLVVTPKIAQMFPVSEILGENFGVFAVSFYRKFSVIYMKILVAREFQRPPKRNVPSPSNIAAANLVLQILTRNNLFVIRILVTMLLKMKSTISFFKKQLWGGQFWSDGYFVSTVGAHASEEVIKQYVKNQGNSEENIQPRLF